ncbi:MAG: hypothetical protein JWR05_2536 [Mucilaginibacter sp.]|nr:hypothetical protein [Mucilaginibacter sp.]
MQRVRMSLPYFKELGWNAEVVCVDERHSEMVKDDLLLQSLPQGQVIHTVMAFNIKWTGKIGLGSLALRSMWFYMLRVNQLLTRNKYDLIYFSTTQFPICILGRYWKNKFGVPYVIDMQDPWHSGYYKDKPKNERPKKYWFSYRLNKWLEPLAIKKADGLISVSANYIETLKVRYSVIKNIPSAIIPFGFLEKDMEIAANSPVSSSILHKNHFNCVYVGRGGHDMEKALTLLFTGLKTGLSLQPDLFSNIRFYFLGTSYAPLGTGKKTILPLAEKLAVAEYIHEETDRLPFYQSIATLIQADALIIPGSDNAEYTASKIFPYILTNKPLLAVFHEKSSTVQIISKCSPQSDIVTFPGKPDEIATQIFQILKTWLIKGPNNISFNKNEFNLHSAKEMTRNQTDLFNLVIK